MKDYLSSNPDTRRPRSLADSLKRRANIDVGVEPVLCAMIACLDIAEALSFMHKCDTLHGDLKPQNILLASSVRAPSLLVPCARRPAARTHPCAASKPGSEEERNMQKDPHGFCAKISDFGQSRHMTPDQEFVVVSQGSAAYLPGEVFRDLKMTKKCDVYSLGIVMWEILTGIFWHTIHRKEMKNRRCAPRCTKLLFLQRRDLITKHQFALHWIRDATIIPNYQAAVAALSALAQAAASSL